MPKVKVLIVDDAARVRADLRAVLPLAGEIEIVGEAADGHEAIAQTEALRPDVVLMDLEMPVLDGYAATRAIKAQSHACRVVALTVHSYPAARDQAAQSGVDAFVVKGASLANLVAAVVSSQ